MNKVIISILLLTITIILGLIAIFFCYKHCKKSKDNNKKELENTNIKEELNTENDCEELTAISDDIEKDFTDNIIDEEVSITEEITVDENLAEEVEISEEPTKTVEVDENPVEDIKSDDKLREDLDAFRLTISTENNIKPYTVFNNSDLDLIIQVKPKTIDELKEMKGFGKVKCGKYGEDIINIVKKYTI